ncbi:RNA polymerase II transcription factor B subunit 3-like isoform X5 [Rhododendron vialii]|uniref:RNA polymerase II transcription factor B subunit 3-like isoform X5 n=1 Tax=Rhododendron vialii TaxID=182163 RepID=UPI00265DE3F4|nr:RNA polymerase II transcription factor B subunit 3-like isoform X5 [Rhododendron vialii]
MVVAKSFFKEMAIRKRIASIFNKGEEEEVEDMTFNLIEGIDVPAIEGKIAQYHKENAQKPARLKNMLQLKPQAKDTLIVIRHKIFDLRSHFNWI